MDEDLEREAVTRVFLAEAQEGLAAMEEGLLALEARGDDEEALAEVFRRVHTLKGNASSLGFEALAHFAHGMEDLLDHLREHRLGATAECVTQLLQAVDVLRELVRSAREGDTVLSSRQRSLLRKLARRAAADRPGRQPPPETAEARPELPGETGSSRARAATLRVEVARLDRMLDLAGEIAVARGRLQQMIEGGTSHQELQAAFLEASRLQADLQEEITHVRMVPVGQLFRSQARTLRDVAAARGRQAALVLQGEEVEVDTSVLELLRDPLIHMVRNAVDHGIEPPARRRAAGKPPTGTVSLQARHEGSSVVVEVSDDGAGIDREGLLARARARGVVAEGERLSEDEVDQLVFRAGLSTAPEVSEISGRGVGMDVVRRNVEALRGSLRVDSRRGAGTTVTVRLPLTLAIIQGFTVVAGGEAFVIPMDTVEECVELRAHEGVASGVGGVLNLRGEALPYVRLRRHFALGGAEQARENVVVVRDARLRAGFAVDALLGERQAVIKPLGRLFRGLPGISGSTILGDGRVALILDVAALLRQAVAHQHAGEREVAHA